MRLLRGKGWMRLLGGRGEGGGEMELIKSWLYFR